MFELLGDILKHNPVIAGIFASIVAIFLGDGLRRRVMNIALPTEKSLEDVRAEVRMNALNHKALLQRIDELERLVREVEHAEIDAA